MQINNKDFMDMNGREVEELKNKVYESTKELVDKINTKMKEANESYNSISKEIGSAQKTIKHILTLEYKNLYFLNFIAQTTLGKEFVLSEGFNRISIFNEELNIDKFRKAAIYNFNKFTKEIEEKLIELGYSFKFLSDVLGEKITDNLLKDIYSNRKYNSIITFIIVCYKYDMLLNLKDIKEIENDNAQEEENNQEYDYYVDIDKSEKTVYENVENIDANESAYNQIQNEISAIMIKISDLLKNGVSFKEIKELLENKTIEVTDESIKNLISNHYSNIKQSIHDYEDSKIKELLYSIDEEKKANLNDVQYDILKQARNLENNVLNSLKIEGLNF